MKVIVLALCFVLSTLKTTAQQFGGFPPSTQWKQINTDTVRIIYSGNVREQAERIANLIHREAQDTSFSIGKKLRKINIVLQDRTTMANGYVALAPFRSEFYLIPGASDVFEFGNLPWHDNLALHEYRHVKQYNNYRKGLSKGMFYLFGEQGQALANSLTIPDWLFEGDAVHAETALSQQGRGRMPSFVSGYNSLWLEGKNYSWQKLRNGSLKDYVPNHYPLGYLLTNYGYLKYGSDFWEKVTADASAGKGLFYPFQKAIKKYAGVDYKTFRKDAFSFYKQQLEGEEVVSREKNSTSNNTVSNYFFPQFISQDSILYLKKTYSKIPAFYIKDKHGAHRLAQQSISDEEWFSYRNRKLVYTAYSTHARWGLVDYSDIVVMDIDTKSEKRITARAKYFTPDFSPSGKKIIAVRINDSLQTELRILNAADGAVLKEISSVHDYYYMHPRFVDEDKIVVGTRTPDAKMALRILNISNGKWEELVPESFNTISLPFVANGNVYFISNASGNDEVYAIGLKDKEISRLTNDKTGNYYPAVLGDSLVWAHFTAHGLQLRTQALDSITHTVVNEENWQGRAHTYPLSLSNDITGSNSRKFTEKPYSKATGLFNFHSWSPAYNDPELTVSLYSENILNTFSNELFYRYNQNEASNAVGWNLSYGGFFPVLTAGVDYTYDRHLKFSEGTLTLNQLEVKGGYTIPLNFSKGKTYKTLNFGSDYVFTRLMPSGVYKNSFEPKNRSYLRHTIMWSHHLPVARQQINPKLGWSSIFQYNHLLADKGSQLYANSFVFLPSVGNHSIVINGSFQETDTNNVVFSNRFPASRGYDDYYFSRMWKIAGNYHFPIAYPDFGVASIIYFQRLRANVFYDYSRVYSGDKTAYANLKSVGGELYFDTRWWNQLPITFGFRLSHLLDNGFSSQDRKGDNRFEFILPVNLY